MTNTLGAPPASLMIVGEVASSGLARGRALLCGCARQPTLMQRREVSAAEAQTDIERFDTAVTAAECKLLEVQERVRRSLGKDEAEIFAAQILLLRDVQLRNTVTELCLTERLNVEAAVDEAIKQLSLLFASLDDPYFRERATDLLDVGKRLLDHLAQDLPPAIPVHMDGCVMVTREILASVVAQLQGQGVRGLIVEKGGVTAHASILALALGIPMLVQTREATEKLRADDLVIVDALAGRAFINPPPEIVRKYDRLEVDLQTHKSALKDLIDLPSATIDDVQIKLSANIGQTANTSIVTKACRLLDEVSEPLSLTQLAKSVDLSPQYFHRLSKKVTGLTPKAYATAGRSTRLRSSV